MIFTLVTAVQEKLNEIVDMMKNRIEEEKRRKEREAEEAEKVGKRKASIFVYLPDPRSSLKHRGQQEV